MKTFTYDAAGNTTTDNTSSAGQLTLDYFNSGRLMSVTVGRANNSYAYNGLSQRVTKTLYGSSAPNVFVYDEAGHLIGEYDSAGNALQEHIWLGDTPVAMLRTLSGSTQRFYVMADQTDTPRALANTSGTIVWRWDGEAFGMSAPNQDPDGDYQSVNYNLRFPGQYFDAESNLVYNDNRDYDPLTGRYVQSDPIGLQGGINNYAYVNGNPLGFVDPFGLASAKIQGNKIQVHKNDVDPWPSDPHGHIYDKNQVVDKEGNIYNKSTKQSVGSLSKKGMKLWGEFLKKIEGKMCLPLMIDDLLKAFCQENPTEPACLIIMPPDPTDPCKGVPSPYCIAS